MTTKTEPKEYTKAEIQAFTLILAETFAAKLDWPGRSKHGWGGRQDLRRYKTTGFPTRYRSQAISNRHEFLIARLLAARQDTWNPAMKELAELKKREEEAREAAKPKVKITTVIHVAITLKDCRRNGRTFILEKKGDYVRCGLHAKSGGTAGQSVCSAKGNYKISDLSHAVALATSIKRPIDIADNPKAKLNVTVTLMGTRIEDNRGEGAYNLLIEGRDNVIWVSQESEYYDSNKWHFNTKDIQEAIDALNKEYTFTVAEKTPPAITKKDE